MNRNTVFNLTKEKFRESEHVIAICDCYQIADGEHKNRLLALVSSSGSHALFAIAATNWPPEFFSDLHVVSVFRLDEQFRIEAAGADVLSTDSISPNRLVVQSSNAPATTFYFNPCSAELPVLQREIGAAEQQRPPTAEANFRWTDAYEHNDLLQIDRHIADGTAPLMNRDSKWREELLLRQNEYMRFNEYRIYTATWNVNEKLSPADIDLHEWLSTSEEPPDIYAVAFQELDMNAKSIAIGETKRDAMMEGWINKVMRGLHPGATYEELVAVRLVGMILVIAVRRELRKNIVKVNTQTVGTGALNYMGNKGAVGVSFVMNEARICFVNAHLAAHTNEVQKRNDNYAEIMRRMQFAYDIQRVAIEEHDHIFWIGDLNYRLTEPLTREQYETAAPNVLLAFDQLHAEQSARRVFHGFSEGAITFQPTYKYDPGTDHYDSSEKSRPPAWCDRILWKGARIAQQTYGSVMQLRLSDHKPVFATFTCGVKSIDEEKYNRVNADVLKHVDKYENDNQPQITVEKTDIDFREIRFNETYTEDFIVANNCHLPVDFEFRSNSATAAGAAATPGSATTTPSGIPKICESWLNVEPTSGRLITGKSMSIRLKLRIDAAAAWRMHRKQKEPGGDNGALDILVLHVKNGADIFITVMGKYRPSCFGFSIETLIRLERPVARMDLMELMEVESRADFLSTLPASIQIPREVFMLVDLLYRRGMKTPNLFTADRRWRNDPDVNALRDQLDEWTVLRRSDVEAVDGGRAEVSPQAAAEALLMLLEASPDALVSPLEEECLYASNAEERCGIVAALSPTRRNVFLYVCLFLVDLLEHSKQNLCTLETLANLFGQAMLRGKGRPYRWLTNQDVVQRRTKYMSELLTVDIRDLVQREFNSLIPEQVGIELAEQ